MPNSDRLVKYLQKKDGILISEIEQEFSWSKQYIGKLLNSIEGTYSIERVKESLGGFGSKTYQKRIYLGEKKLKNEKTEIQKLKEKIKLLEDQNAQLTMLNRQLIDEKLKLENQFSIEHSIIINILIKFTDLVTINCIHGAAKKLKIKLDSGLNKDELVKKIVTRFLEQELPQF